MQMQAVYRGHLARQQYAEMRRQRSALVIQTNWRGAVQRSDFQALRGAAVVVQNAFRYVADHVNILRFM